MQTRFFQICSALAVAAFGIVIGANPGTVVAQQAVDAKLAARIVAEKDARKACKVEICKVFAAKKGEGAPIACDVTKTWLDADVQGRLGSTLTWPWGAAQCTAKVELDRSALAKLIADPDATVKLKKHDVSCSLDRKAPETGEAYGVKLSIAPEITFKGGKATKVVMGWGEIDAPTLAKGAIWTATATDNTFNVLGASMVSEINSFIYTNCKEVGIDIPEQK